MQAVQVVEPELPTDAIGNSDMETIEDSGSWEEAQKLRPWQAGLDIACQDALAETGRLMEEG